MDVTFKSTKLQKCFNSDTELQKKYGKTCARQIRARLDDLAAARSLQAFGQPMPLPGRCHELKGDRKGQLSLDLEHPLRLIFVASGELVQFKEDGGLDWDSVNAIQVIEIEDTHD